MFPGKKSHLTQYCIIEKFPGKKGVFTTTPNTPNIPKSCFFFNFYRKKHRPRPFINWQISPIPGVFFHNAPNNPISKNMFVFLTFFQKTSPCANIIIKKFPQSRSDFFPQRTPIPKFSKKYFFAFFFLIPQKKPLLAQYWQIKNRIIRGFFPFNPPIHSNMPKLCFGFFNFLSEKHRPRQYCINWKKVPPIT